MHNILFSLAFASLLFFVSITSGAAESLSHSDYKSRFENAKSLLNKKKYDDALREFESLFDATLFEVPNYEPLLYIAKTKYLAGQINEANSDLQQFKCMVRVDSGIKKCSNASNYAQSTPDNIVLHESDFTNLDLCYQTMCSGLYHSYYDDPSKETLREIARFWSKIDFLQNDILAKMKK